MKRSLVIRTHSACSSACRLLAAVALPWDRQGDQNERQPMILAVSGSLKRSSVNSAALRAAARVAAASGIAVTISDAVRELPHFDPDLEAAPPESVLRFRAACAAASGLLLAVPEYAFGIPGAFKNALDWTVGSGALYRKPVALLDVAPRGRGAHVREALDHVLNALDAEVAHYSVPVSRFDRSATGEICVDRILDPLRAVVGEFVHLAGA
jgi:NAD(P)H-dependent FMN reductase